METCVPSDSLYRGTTVSSKISVSKKVCGKKTWLFHNKYSSFLLRLFFDLLHNSPQLLLVAHRIIFDAVTVVLKWRDFCLSQPRSLNLLILKENILK